jgi:hypothetical protein
MIPSQAILVCDRDNGFRQRYEICSPRAIRRSKSSARCAGPRAATRDLWLHRHRNFVGSREHLWAMVVRRRQPDAKLLFVVRRPPSPP